MLVTRTYGHEWLTPFDHNQGQSEVFPQHLVEMKVKLVDVDVYQKPLHS